MVRNDDNALQFESETRSDGQHPRLEWTRIVLATRPRSSEFVHFLRAAGGWRFTLPMTSDLIGAKRKALAQLGSNERPFSPEWVRVSGLESWTGRVLEIDDELFTAELVPTAGGQKVVADFNRSLLGNERDLVAGDFVYVTVRMVRGPGGYPNRTSSIRLRRLGNWTPEEISSQNARAEATAQELESVID